MRLSLSIQTLALALCLAVPAASQAKKTAKKSSIPPVVKAGYALIYQGKIADALAHFKKLEVDQPGNRWSKKAMRPLTQAVRLEKIIAKDRHPKWASAAKWLQTFYSKNKVPTKLLALSTRATKLFPKDETWTLRHAQALTANGDDKKALAVYDALAVNTGKPTYRAMAAVLCARGKNAAGASAQIAAIPKNFESSTTSYNIACAYAILGKIDLAGKLLNRAFELTPMSKLPALKKQAVADPDLANMAKTKALANALEAISLVPEFEEKKADCEGCPSKSSCSDKEKEDCKDDEKKKDEAKK